MAIISWWPLWKASVPDQGSISKATGRKWGTLWKAWWQAVSYLQSHKCGSNPLSGIYSVCIEYMSNGPHEHTHALTKHLSDFSCWDPFDLVECCAASMNSLTLPQNVLPSQQPCSHHDYTVWQQRIQWYQHKYAYSWKHRASRSMEAQSANW